MKIIGVSGGSGSGKSTVAKRLASILPDAELIGVDKFMRKVTVEKESEILKVMGIKYTEGEYSHNYYVNEYYFRSFDDVKIWFNTIKEPVNNMIEEAIKRCTDKEYVVVDWLYLSVCDFYSKCNYTLFVKTDKDITENRLRERLKNKSMYKKNNDGSYSVYKTWAIENRVKYTSLDKFGYKSQYQITNNGDFSSLYKKVDEFAACLTEKSDKTIIKFFEFK